MHAARRTIQWREERAARRRAGDAVAADGGEGYSAQRHHRQRDDWCPRSGRGGWRRLGRRLSPACFALPPCVVSARRHTLPAKTAMMQRTADQLLAGRKGLSTMALGTALLSLSVVSRGHCGTYLDGAVRLFTTFPSFSLPPHPYPLSQRDQYPAAEPIVALCAPGLTGQPFFFVRCD